MEVPELQLIDVESIKGLPEGIGELKGRALAVKRFDRSADGPVHMEDFAQVFGVFPDEVRQGQLPEHRARSRHRDRRSRRRRVCPTPRVQHADRQRRHASEELVVDLPRPPHARPVPAYDLLSTIPYIADDKMALNYSRTKKMTEFSKDELTHLAAKAKISEKLAVDTAAEIVQRFKKIWSERKGDLPLEKKVVEVVDAHAASIPIYSEL